MKEKTFERRTELLNAALDEFTMKNYEEASLNRIIKNAGISKGTFYYHFEDKQALYLHLLKHSVDTKWGFIRDQIKEEITGQKTIDIFNRFKLQAQIGAEFAKHHPKYHKLGIMFAKEKGKEIYDIANEMLGNNSESLLGNMIEEAIEDGDFREDLPKEFIHRLISYMLIHFTDIFETEGDLEIEKMIENLDYFVDFLKNGLGK